MSLEIVFTLLLTLLFVCYCAIHFLVGKGLNSLVIRQQSSSREKVQISVIIAARNEEANIGRCLQAFVGQNYPPDLFEVIVVDDRSNDATAAIAKNYQSHHPFVNVLKIENSATDLPAKKNALNEAIKKSRFDILAFTDADCIVPSHWLASIAKEFTPDTGLVAGYSPIEQRFPSPFFARWGDFFLRYLEMKNSVGAAAAIGLNKAYLCTGRNLAYRKCVFEEVGGYEKIKHSISGDDDLFIQLVQKETSWKIRYMLSPGSHVETIPPASVSAFIHQRKRHFSAGRYYPVRMKVVFGMLHSFNALAFIALAIVPSVGILALGGKFIIDMLIFSKAIALFGDRRLFRSVVPLEIASVVYNSFIGPLGFFGTFYWKEEKP